MFGKKLNFCNFPIKLNGCRREIVLPFGKVTFYRRRKLKWVSGNYNLGYFMDDLEFYKTKEGEILNIRILSHDTSEFHTIKHKFTEERNRISECVFCKEQTKKENNVMGQWKLQLTFTPGLGIYFTWSKQEIAIAIPFVTCYIGLSKSASGFDIFGKRKY